MLDFTETFWIYFIMFYSLLGLLIVSDHMYVCVSAQMTFQWPLLNTTRDQERN